MFKHGEWWLPDGEEHLVEMLDKHSPAIVYGRPAYQYHKYQFAKKWIKDTRRAIDVGAHVGLWSYHLSYDFDFLNCFEPSLIHFECWANNMRDRVHATIHARALGATAGMCELITTPHSSGDTYIAPSQNSDEIEMKTLDWYGFQDIDFMKVDCEGYEYFVMEGAEETLRRCKPCIIIEQKPNKASHFGIGEQDAIELLLGFGAKVRKVYSGDFILSWD